MYQDQSFLFGSILIFLCSLIAIPIIIITIREFTLWYYKINQIVTLLGSIDAKLEKIAEKPGQIDASDLIEVGSMNVQTNVKEEQPLEVIIPEVDIEKTENIWTKKYYIKDLFRKDTID